jgi:hypothetical protein
LIRYAALTAGLLLLAFILQDAFEGMLLPRRVMRRISFMRLYFRVTWAFWAAAARARPVGAKRERLLSVFGPLAMMLLFVAWTTGLILSFGLIQWAAQQAHGSPPLSSLPEQIYMSGVTFFTLGYGDVLPHTNLARFAAVLEAGAGLGFIAVVIGYLPVLYQLFSRREAHVIQLDGRAGSPPTATGMLKRHAESDGLSKLDELLRAWEIWGADLLESHLSYPMLAYYRSQHDNQSWLGALVAIMDTCAAILVGVEDIKPLQARMTFAMARQVVLEMARSLSVTAARTPSYNRLDHDAYAKMQAVFSDAGLTWNGGPHAEETLAAVRATYEPLLEALADYLLIPLPGWVAADDASDHWERGARGIIARRLIEGLAGGDIASDGGQGGGANPGTRSGRLRNRLRDR